AADPGRPLNGLPDADLGLPGVRHLAQVVGEVIAGPAAVGAMNHRDVAGRKTHASVERLDAGVVPSLHGAQEDVGQSGPVELQLLHSREVVADRDHAERGGRLYDLVRAARILQLRGGHGNVTGTEVDSAVGELLDAGARADCLIVDTDVRILRGVG